MDSPDTYRTLHRPSSESLFKDRNSKFYGYAYPVSSEAEVKDHIQILKKKHHNARHWCYAYRIGTDPYNYRMNDDGEPNNSAGQPIYGQILSFELTNVLVVVVRYFGGTKLGVGGLINAYKRAAQITLESSKIKECTIDDRFKLNFEYKDLSRVMRIVKARRLEIVSQDLQSSCELIVAIRRSESKAVYDLFDQFYGIVIEQIYN